MRHGNAKVAQFMRLESPAERLRLVCGQVHRSYEGAATVAVRLASQEDAGRLDEMLWTFHDISFIPHVRFSEAREPLIEPVIIYCAHEPLGEADVLIDASGGEPHEDFRHFSSLFDFAEVYDESLREASRRRYRAYQQAGYSMSYVR